MPLFKYKARTSAGDTVQGTIETPDQFTASNKLRGQRLIVLEITLAKKNLLDELKKYNPFKPSITARDLVLFSRQLSTLVSAGIPIVQGLTILSEQIENPAFKKVVNNISDNIKAGISIAEAMKKEPDAFSELYVAMIRAGEVGGILDVILERLSAYLEAADELKGKVKGALMYPSIVAFIAACITIFLLTVVIPTFQTIFANFGADLPLPTKILIALSNFLKQYIIFLIAGVIAAAVAVVKFY
ncbi:MAG: pilus assembly protein PilC, partial [Elusimicrobia bacterium HGW-Elusimicrobia-4]